MAGEPAMEKLAQHALDQSQFALNVRKLSASGRRAEALVEVLFPAFQGVLERGDMRGNAQRSQ